MTYNEQYTYALDSTFQQQILQAIVTAAEQISSEVNTTPNHANRVALAKLVLNNSNLYVYPFAQAVAAAGPYTSTQSDANIATQVASVWNGIAGVV